MKISLAESRVMDALWRIGEPVSSEDLTTCLEDQDWAHGTVRTLLTRLVKKKAVLAKMTGRKYLYSPLVARQDYVQSESRGLLDRLFEGRLAPFVTQFAEREQLTAQDVAELKALIDKLDDGAAR